jgi:hypothetical protein
LITFTFPVKCPYALMSPTIRPYDCSQGVERLTYKHNTKELHKAQPVLWHTHVIHHNPFPPENEPIERHAPYTRADLQ